MVTLIRSLIGPNLIDNKTERACYSRNLHPYDYKVGHYIPKRPQNAGFKASLK